MREASKSLIERLQNLLQSLKSERLSGQGKNFNILVKIKIDAIQCAQLLEG